MIKLRIARKTDWQIVKQTELLAERQRHDLIGRNTAIWAARDP